MNLPSPPLPDDEPAEARVISVIEERLDVTRRVVDTGRTLRVRKVVDEERVEVDEPLVDEFVDVERVVVNRVVDGPVAVRHEGDVMIVPVVEERLVVHKELVLLEEIRVVRRREPRRFRQTVTLRREHVVVERFDPLTGSWAVVDDGRGASPTPGPDPPTPAG